MPRLATQHNCWSNAHLYYLPALELCFWCVAYVITTPVSPDKNELNYYALCQPTIYCQVYWEMFYQSSPWPCEVIGLLSLFLLSVLRLTVLIWIIIHCRFVTLYAVDPVTFVQAMRPGSLWKLYKCELTLIGFGNQNTLVIISTILKQCIYSVNLIGLNVNLSEIVRAQIMRAFIVKHDFVLATPQHSKYWKSQWYISWRAIVENKYCFSIRTYFLYECSDE